MGTSVPLALDESVGCVKPTRLSGLSGGGYPLNMLTKTDLE